MGFLPKKMLMRKSLLCNRDPVLRCKRQDSCSAVLAAISKTRWLTQTKALELVVYGGRHTKKRSIAKCVLCLRIVFIATNKKVCKP